MDDRWLSVDEIAAYLGVVKDTIIVEKEPRVGTKGTYRMRDPDEARKKFSVPDKEKVRIGGKLEVRILHRKDRILDNDLPEIAKAYAEFRVKHPEPCL